MSFEQLLQNHAPLPEFARFQDEYAPFDLGLMDFDIFNEDYSRDLIRIGIRSPELFALGKESLFETHEFTVALLASYLFEKIKKCVEKAETSPEFEDQQSEDISWILFREVQKLHAAGLEMDVELFVLQSLSEEINRRVEGLAMPGGIWSRAFYLESKKCPVKQVN